MPETAAAAHVNNRRNCVDGKIASHKVAIKKHRSNRYSDRQQNSYFLSNNRGFVDRLELLKQLLTYWETKNVQQKYKALKTAKARAEYAQAHEREFKLSNAAVKYFKDHGITKLPSTKALQAEMQQFTSEKNVRYKDYRETWDRVEELERVRSNLETMPGHTKEKRNELILS